MTSESLVVSGISKRYVVRRGAALSLRGLLLDRRSGETVERGWALRDVSFEVAPGTTTALIGGNGAGKSTLLRVAAGLTTASEGHVRIPPDTLSILSFGGNFDGTLTGRENAETALIVNGLSRHDARTRLDAVLDFSELYEAFEEPVRTYSAGMVLRLAFGVAVQLRAGAFLLDEVLTVGDLAFQEKCVAYLDDVRASGATILFATHDMSRVEELATQVVWLQKGHVRMVGPAEHVLDAYRDAMRSDTYDATPEWLEDEDEGPELRSNRFGSQEVRLSQIRVNGAQSAVIPSGGPLRVEAVVRPRDGERRAVLGVTVRRVADGVKVVDENAELGLVDDERHVRLDIDRLDLVPGRYAVDIGVYASDWSLAYDYHWDVHKLEVTGAPSGAEGLIRPPMRWTTAAEVGEGVRGGGDGEEVA
jgi:lipopolysaccharide transport system ATP-binding protein